MELFFYFFQAALLEAPKKNLHKANAEIANHIISYRMKEVWGEATTGGKAPIRTLRGHPGNYLHNYKVAVVFTLLNNDKQWYRRSPSFQ